MVFGPQEMAKDFHESTSSANSTFETKKQLRSRSAACLSFHAIKTTTGNFWTGGAIEPRKKPSYFPLYWLVNRDPYNGL